MGQAIYSSVEGMNYGAGYLFLGRGVNYGAGYLFLGRRDELWGRLSIPR